MQKLFDGRVDSLLLEVVKKNFKKLNRKLRFMNSNPLKCKYKRLGFQEKLFEIY